MGVGIKDKYSIGIDGAGYILKGSPAYPAHLRRIVKSQVSRLAVSDIQYSDFANDGNFFVAQTDWSGGIKSEKEWKDDAKYWYSSNIDAYSEQGTLKLENEVQLEKDFTNEVWCGGLFMVNGVLECYVGTKAVTSSNIKIYKQTALGTWADVAGTEFATQRYWTTCLVEHKNKLWALTIGDTTADAVERFDGTSWVDYTAAIDAVATGDVYSASCGCDFANIFYAFVKDNSVVSRYSLVSTVDEGANWVEEFTALSSFVPVAVLGYIDKLYYLLCTGSDYVLYSFNITTNATVLIQKFRGSAGVGLIGSENLLRVFGGKLIISIPNQNIYSFDGDQIIEIYKQDLDKLSVGVEGSVKFIAHGAGAVEANGKLYWGNLIYDGEAFYNHKKPLGDSYTHQLVPVFSDNSGRVYYADTSADNISKIYRDNTTFKGTLAANRLIFNEIGQIPSIDKMMNSITIIHDKLASGESFKMEYSIDGRTTWVAVGTKTYIGDTLTKKTWIIPGNVLYNKIWLRLSMAGSATSPKIRDVILSYRPMPDYKNLWQMRLDFGNEIHLLNGQKEQRDCGELYSQFWNKMAVKQKVLFEDTDYCDCILATAMTSSATSCAVDDTNRFPRQGRIRVVSGSVAEEMYYTSAGSKKLLGITRAARGTVARGYPSGTVMKNDYDVYIDDLKTDTAFSDQNKTEDTATVVLIEV